MKDFLENIDIDDELLVHNNEPEASFTTDRRIIVSAGISEGDGRFNEPDFITALIKKRLDATDFKGSVLKFDINTVTTPSNWINGANIYTDVKINGKICNPIDGFKLLWALNYGYQTPSMKNCVMTFISHDSEEIDESTERIIFGGMKLIGETFKFSQPRSYMFDNKNVYAYSKKLKNMNWPYNVPLSEEDVSNIANLISECLVDRNSNSNAYSERLRLYEYCGMLSGLIDFDIVKQHIRSAMATFDSDSLRTKKKTNSMYNNYYHESIDFKQKQEIENIIENSSKRFKGIDDVLRNIYWAQDESYCKRTLFIITKEYNILYGDETVERELVLWKGFPEQCCPYTTTVLQDAWAAPQLNYTDCDSVYSNNANMFIRNIGRIKKRSNNMIRRLNNLSNSWHSEFDCVVSDDPNKVMFAIKVGDVVDYDTNVIISASIGFYGPYVSVLENIKVLFGTKEKVKNS